MRLILILILPLCFALPTAARAEAPLDVVAATLPGPAVRVSWPALPNASLGCVTRIAARDSRLIMCAAPRLSYVQQGPHAVDANLRLAPGDLVEVRVWDVDGNELGRGRARVARYWLALPLLRR